MMACKLTGRRPSPSLVATLCLAAALAGPAGAAEGALPDAASACAALTTDQLEAHIDRARQALMDEDLATVDSVQADLVAAAPCLDSVVDPELWARHLVSLAIAAYVRNDDWQTPLASALAASPTVNRVVRGDTLFARWTPPPTAPRAATTVPYDVHAWLDGRRVTVAEALRGPHLVQVEVDGVLTSRLVDADGSDAAWQALLPAAAPSAAPTTTASAPAAAPDDGGGHATPWLLAGGAAAALGTGTGILTWSMRAQGDRDPGKQTALVGGNVAGWSVAAVGGALLGVGLVQVLDAGPTVRIGPGTLSLEGRF